MTKGFQMDDWQLHSEAAVDYSRGNEHHSHEHRDRRNIVDRSKAALQRLLTDQQKMTVNTHEGFGWRFFVRNAKSNTPTVFIVSPDKQSVILIDEYGDLEEDHDIVFRP